METVRLCLLTKEDGIFVVSLPLRFWSMRSKSIIGLRFIKPAMIRSWAFVYFPTGRPIDRMTVEAFLGEVVKVFRSTGIQTPAEIPSVMEGNPQGNIKQIVTEAISIAHNKFGSPPSLLMVLIQGGPSIPLYAKLKSLLDNMGIASQVMVAEKSIMKLQGQMQYLANIAAKVNPKLGGTNHILDEVLMKSARVMFIGAVSFKSCFRHLLIF